MAPKKLMAGLAAALSIGLAVPTQAAFLSGIVTLGVINTFQDESRELFFDNPGGVPDRTFGVGDVSLGFLRVDDKIGPNAFSLNNSVYAIFAQQVTAMTATTVTFGAVTAPGLSLSALGVAGALPTDTIALYTNAAGFGTNLITTNPGNMVGGAAITMADYLAYIIANGTLEMRAGLTDTPLCTGGTADCFGANVAGGVAFLTTDQISQISSSLNVGTFVGGLSTSLDPAGMTLLDATPAGIFPPGVGAPLTLAQLSLLNGAVSGSVGAANAANWTNGSELAGGIYTQCTLTSGAVVPCGFVDNTTIAFLPVPEPDTLALLGLGLMGLGAARLRRKQG